MQQNTVLNDRVLWFDGDSSFDPSTLADMVLNGVKLKSGIFVSDVTEEIKQFNLISDYQLVKKTENRPFDYSWKIPNKYITLNLRDYLLQLLEDEVVRHKSFTGDEIKARINRVNLELERFYEANMHMLLRTTIFIIDTFKEKNVVWGVGRGSSCSSYILYLVGVHDIDSVLYDLDITDFLR
jgi:DNA polymerase III alpha subunit